MKIPLTKVGGRILGRYWYNGLMAARPTTCEAAGTTDHGL